MSAEQSTPLSYPQLVEELRRACVEKRTGTMMIATHDNQLARILLRDGEIVSISYRLKNGLDAVPLLKEITQARVKFSQGKTGADQANGALPATDEIMRMLGGIKAVPPTPTPTAGTVGADQVPKALKIIETELTEFLGPLANFVWTEHLERAGKPMTANKLRALVDGLAKEIGDPTKVQLFKEKIWQRIGGTK